MLQQTQASRVVGFYRTWLKNFPSMQALAASSTASVLKSWSGLGYNSRALRLHTLARTIMAAGNGRLPDSVDELHRLPGIGRYTAHAISCFAFGQHVPVVDVNIRRILTRLSKKISSPREMVDEQRAWTLADAILCRTDAYSWNQALMDLGATICTPSRPDCVRCPVSRFCRSAFSPALNKRTAAAPKTEPEWKGVPRRLYRGKILAMLHDKHSTPNRLARQLWSPARRDDIAWLVSVLAMMEKDGLVRKKGMSYGIA